MRRGVKAVAVLVAVGAVFGVASPAVASDALPVDQRDAGLWYANDWWKFDELQGSGATGAGVKIAVVDTFLNPDVPELAGADVTVRGSTCADPQSGEPREVVSDDPALAAHGTNVVSMLVGNGTAGDGGPGTRGVVPEAEVWFYGVGALDQTTSAECKLTDPTVQPGGIDLSRDVALYGTKVVENVRGIDGDATALAARAAIRDGADIVSVSVLSGLGDWEQVLVEAQLAGAVVVSGTENPTTSFGITGGPGDTNGAVPVSAVDSAGDPLKIVDDAGVETTGLGSSMLAFAAPGDGLLGVGSDSGWGPSLISGTSYATPLVAGGIALGLQKYPEASAFQVLQAMIRTTDSGELHEPNWTDDLFGYGYANPSGMLAVDPTEFPDENPMFVTSVDDPRCVSRGEPGYVVEDGKQKGEWICGWSSGPFPPAVDAYRAVVEDGAQVLGTNDELVNSVYAKAAAGDADGGAGDSETGPDWLPIVAIAGGVLVLAAVAVVIPVTVVRSRRRAQQVEAVGGVPPQNDAQP